VRQGPAVGGRDPPVPDGQRGRAGHDGRVRAAPRRGPVLHGTVFLTFFNFSFFFVFFIAFLPFFQYLLIFLFFPLFH
jgi:hypothetical protein